MIVWHMLKNNEPYRYSQPEPTQAKLARLRVAVTKTKRVGGTKRGEPRPANYGTGTGSRRIPSLPKVFEQEGLPAAKAPSELAAAERKALHEMGVAKFVAAIQTERVVERKPRGKADKPIAEAEESA